MPNTRFLLGSPAFQRNNPTDWESVWTNAVKGKLLDIPADIRIRHYRTLKGISADYSPASAIERTTIVYWGTSGSGKTRRAWEEAGVDAYTKDPRTKWYIDINHRWCGYADQPHVILDEFRGCIDIAHILRWLDRYPVRVEVKGSTRPLMASKIWITSNLPPVKWYPELDAMTLEALMRRLSVVEEFK